MSRKPKCPKCGWGHLHWRLDEIRCVNCGCTSDLIDWKDRKELKSLAKEWGFESVSVFVNEYQSPFRP